MADDITLTVRVRDLTRGDFDRLRGQLNGMRRNLQGVNRATASAGQHSQRLARDIDGLNGTLNRMQQTGRLSRRELTGVNNTLRMMSRSAMQAAQSGEITQDRFNGLNGEIRRMREEFDRLGQGLTQNNTRLRNTGNQVNRTVRMVNGMVRSVNTTTRSLQGNTRVINTTNRTFGDLGNSASSAAKKTSFMGGTFSNMRQKGIGLAVMLGVTLLPTIGALAPMLAGLGSVAGVAALAFSGLDKPTKFLSKSQKEFLTALKPVTKEFGNLRRSAQEAVLPKLTKNFDDVAKTVKDLNPVVKIAGDTFGDLVGKIARGVSSKDFMGPFTQNVRMGTRWLDQFASSFGTFSIKFFEFGTKSQPALDAWQNLLGGFLDRGLPNMFKELETGIGGSSEFLTALGNNLNNNLLPGVAKLAAEFMKAFGPMLGEMITAAGRAFTFLVDALSVGFQLLAPFAATITDGFRAMSEVFSITMSVAGSLAKALGGALLETLMSVAGVDMSKSAGSFTQFSDYVKANSAQIRMGLVMVGIAIIDMVNIGIQMLPILIASFKTLSDMVIFTLDVMISGLVKFGQHLPGPTGQMFRDMGEGWGKMKKGWNESLDAMVTKSSEFAAAAGPNLSRAKIVLQVDQAKAQLEYIKQQLKDPELTKERRAKLTADKKAAEQRINEAEAALKRFDGKKATAKFDANVAPYFDAKRRADAARLKDKTGNLKANPNPFWAAVRGLIGKVLGTSYVNVQRRFVASAADSTAARPFGASGGMAGSLPVKRFADGGSAAGDVLEGPGTKTSDSLVARLSKGEFVMQAKAVDKYGPAFMKAINNGSLRLPGFKKGGMSDSMKSARNELADSFGISHFGKKAGYQRTPFTKGIAAPTDMSALVSALNAARSDIKKAFSGKTESRLLKQLDSAGKALIGWQKKLATVNKALDKAKESLTNLKSEFKQLSESVRDSIMQSGNITKGAQAGEGHVTTQGVMGSLIDSRDKAQSFSGALKKLKEKGLSGALIEQIASAGIEGGGLETAEALMSASSSEIKSMNDLKKQIDSYAKSAGSTAAHAMYDAGIKAAEGLVKGLEKQQDKIEAAMMRIAKSMEKAIKKALGIKSPSKVMEAVGHNTAEGFAVGVKKNRKVDTAWHSMLPRTNGGADRQYGAMPVGVGGGGGGGTGTLIVPISIGGAQVGTAVIDLVRKEVRVRGGNVQAVLGK